MSFQNLTAETKDLLRRKAIDVKAIGLQNGGDRFKGQQERQGQQGQQGPAQVPDIREWRLNLARLSQVHNLFLVAYKEMIYVYEPEHPGQELPAKPSLILSPPKTPLARQGYLDQECPHSVNQLLVDFLGSIEIVLVACDDGDILGYYTNDLRGAIDRRLHCHGPSTILGKEVRPFFMHNTRMSAWGLSVHSKARKIAASANSHEVTVISFGLAHNGYFEVERVRNHKFVLTGFQNNLPTVAFCNTDDDPEGRILIAGDITGLAYIHDLDTLNGNEIMQVGFCRKVGIRCECPDRHTYPHSIWSLAFIDKRVFRRVDGYAPSQLHNILFEKYWNGSIMRDYVPKAENRYRMKRARGERQVETAEISDSSSEIDDENGDDDVLEDEMVISNIFVPTQPSHLPMPSESLAHPWLSTEPTHGSSRMINKSRSTAGREFQHTRWSSPRPTKHAEELSGSIPCPLLVSSKTDLNLLQPEDKGHTVHPIITFERPLYQAYEYGEFGETKPAFTQAAVNRMSLSHIISELGVLIIGSPNGRVALYSLLRTDRWPSRPEGTYFMRLDWLLPFATQEEAGHRPEHKLLGLAASPMQGQLGHSRVEMRRKWRLMMYYADHSILSYEISLAG